VRECLEARAERDLWSLLEIFTRANLLVDIDNQSEFLFCYVLLFCFELFIFCSIFITFFFIFFDACI
jgi:hypothetical protein